MPDSGHYDPNDDGFMITSSSPANCDMRDDDAEAGGSVCGFAPRYPLWLWEVPVEKLFLDAAWLVNQQVAPSLQLQQPSPHGQRPRQVPL